MIEFKTLFDFFHACLAILSVSRASVHRYETVCIRQGIAPLWVELHVEYVGAAIVTFLLMCPPNLYTVHAYDTQSPQGYILHQSNIWRGSGIGPSRGKR